MASVLIKVSCAGEPISGIDILALFPNNTWKESRTDEQGKACPDLYSTTQPMTIFAAGKKFKGCAEFDWVPDERPLSLEMQPLPEGGSAIFSNGTGHLPGLEGRLEPVLDADDRTYLYTENISVNDGQAQPFHFTLGEEVRLADADGNELRSKVLNMVGRSSLLEFRTAPRSAGRPDAGSKTAEARKPSRTAPVRLSSGATFAIDRRLEDIWMQLQGKKPHMPNFLEEISLTGIRGINDLRVGFDYPVSVVAGGNASGKSTVLFAAACAYRVPGAGTRDFVPSTLFPDYRPKSSGRRDGKDSIVIEFDYVTPDGRRSMRWRRSQGWNRSFFGRKGASQPERPVYLRTLSNLSNPSEVRGVLSMSRLDAEPREIPMTASQIEFAHQMLPFRYSEVVNLSSGRRNLLFAIHEGGAAYSELHMASGERAILRLSREIAQLDGALVLIDEVEAGLHPWVQQLLMLQLQQLALRRDLQIIVTSHSPVVLDSVPIHARIFLDRDEGGDVSVIPPYRDMIQSALYGRSADTLNLLCEDETAEGVLRGIFDVLLPKERIRSESIRIGRDTGAEEFPSHAAAFMKFGQIRNFCFVLDGDKRGSDVERKIRDRARVDAAVLFLPGNDTPEMWAWDRLRESTDEAAAALGASKTSLLEDMERLDAIYDSASDRPSVIVKSKLDGLADSLSRNSADICRIVARRETECPDSDIQPLVESLGDLLQNWRAR